MSSNKRIVDNQGFTLIELMIAVFVIGTALVGVFGLFVLALRTAQEGEMRVMAVALANEKAEMVRNLPYIGVGTVGGVPSGAINQNEEVVRGGVTFSVGADIRYIDDEYDGEAPTDLLNTDYKQVRIEVSWESPYDPKPVVMLMLVAPAGLEGEEGAGTLDFRAVDASVSPVSGATVSIINTEVDPAVNIVTQTDENGRVILPGLIPAADSYQLAVGKDGYTAEQTYDVTPDFVPDTDHSHLTAIQGSITEKVFMIDELSSVTLNTKDEFGTSVGLVGYSMRGTKTIGVDGEEEPVYVFDEQGSTDESGSAVHNEAVWDSYDLIIDGSTTGYDIKETSYLLPLVVNPGEAVELDVFLVDHTPLSLHVSVVTADVLPIDNATVRLVGNGIDETLGTGVVGQVFYGDLPVEGDYTLEVDASGFMADSSVVTVDGTNRVVVDLAAE